MKFSFSSTFAHFVQSRGIGRHFRRFALFDNLIGSPASREVASSLSELLCTAANSDADVLLKQLDSHRDGLSAAQADLIRERVGLNQIEQEKPLPWWLHLWHCYRTPFDLLLTFLAAISFVTEDMKATIVIGSMVVISVAIRFLQERKSSSAADKLKAMVSNKVTVIRRDLAEDAMEDARRYFDIQLHPKPARREEIPMTDLVPGEVVVLSAGDMIPGDCRILAAKDLFVSQAAMTGESLPVEKFAIQRDHLATNPLELENIAFMGTNVVSGSATAIVVTTGARTYFGALAQRVTATDRAPTQFQAGVNKVAWLLIRFMVVMVPLVLLINGFTKGDWTEAFLFAMSVAVGLTPEMLPMIVTSTLAKGR